MRRACTFGGPEAAKAPVRGCVWISELGDHLAVRTRSAHCVGLACARPYLHPRWDQFLSNARIKMRPIEGRCASAPDCRCTGPHESRLVRNAVSAALQSCHQGLLPARPPITNIDWRGGEQRDGGIAPTAQLVLRPSPRTPLPAPELPSRHFISRCAFSLAGMQARSGLGMKV